MESVSPSAIEKALRSCNEVGFQVSDGSNEVVPAIILEFSEGDPCTTAYGMLRVWARDLQVIAVLQPHGKLMELSLVNSETNEVVVVRDLLFDEGIFADFMYRVPQNNNLLILPCISPIRSRDRIINEKNISPLVLIRYIVTIP